MNSATPSRRYVRLYRSRNNDMTHEHTRRTRISQGLSAASAVTLCVFVINAIYGNGAVMEMLRWVLLVFLTGLACSTIYFAYWLGFVRPHTKKPKVEANQKLTLDEMGITLEQHAQQYIDKGPLHKLKQLHRNEHRVWTNAFNRLTDQDDRVLPVLDAEDVVTIRDYNGNPVRCTHPRTQVCYNCDDKQGRKRQ